MSQINNKILAKAVLGKQLQPWRVSYYVNILDKPYNRGRWVRVRVREWGLSPYKLIHRAEPVFERQVGIM